MTYRGLGGKLRRGILCATIGALFATGYSVAGNLFSADDVPITYKHAKEPEHAGSMRPTVYPVILTALLGRGTAKREIRIGSGSASLIHREYFLTAAHVVSGRAGESIVNVEIHGKLVRAEIVKIDTELDLAVLHVPNVNCPCIPVGTTNPSVDQNVWIIGFPMYQFKTQFMTEGRIQRVGEDRIIATPNAASGASGGSLIVYDSAQDKLVLVGVLVEISGRSYNVGGGEIVVDHNYITLSVPVHAIREFIQDIVPLK